MSIEAENQPVHASDISQERADETAKYRHEWVGQPDLARVGEVGIWGNKWVGLTHEERDEIDQTCRSQMQALFAIEAKLKEKNT
jgi:hypothetical protein